MKRMFLTLFLFVSFVGYSFSAEYRDFEKVIKNLKQDYDGTVAEFISSLDYSKEEKISNLLEEGFRNAGEREHKRVLSFIPPELRRYIDGDVYINQDTGYGAHYIFFIQKPKLWVSALRLPGHGSSDLISPGSTDFNPGAPLILLNLEKGISITLTFWNKSPATCQITEITR